jgi:sugar O-acyltransferase (sialic acid O-acetyltransferase NeuD family)
MRRLVIIGAGGLGREVLAWARQAVSPLEVKGFLDDNLDALKPFSKNVPLLGTVAGHQPAADEVFICAIGQIEAKRRCAEMVLSRGGDFVNIIHSSAILGDSVNLGRGVIICPHAVVSPDAELGDFVTVNLHSTIAHDAVVGPWSQLHCHVDITGGAILGPRVLVGSHASILPGIRVGDGAIVGAGSIVTRDVEPATTVFGSPARPVTRQPSS